jgi:DNA-binding transcriptional ArsR family regulator
VEPRGLDAPKGSRNLAQIKVHLDFILYFAKHRNINLVFKALADPPRRHILQLLREQPMTAGELAARVTVSKPILSGHFAVLRAADLVDSDKTGTTITYRLKLSVLEEALLEFAQAVGIGSVKHTKSNARGRHA